MSRIFLTACCALLIPLKCFALEPSEKLIFEKNSLYQYIQVIEDTKKNERYVRNQKKEYTQGGIYLDAPEKLLFEFTQMGFVALAFLEEAPRDVLFVGLGAGAMPRYLAARYPEAAIDVAELDPDMLAVAKEYFYFREDGNMKVHVQDGRLFIKRTKKKYDLIVLDAYQNDHIPFHLTTLEFLKEVGSRLKEGGVVSANITAPFRNKFFDSMVVTYTKAFPHVTVFKGKKSANFIFVAGNGNQAKTKVAARARKIEAERNFDIDLEGIASRYEPSKTYAWGGAKILTDDFAPVGLYQYQKSGAQ